MKSSNKARSVLSAVALAALGLAGPASAVQLAPDGMGQVLLYPYYTVRSNQVIVFSIMHMWEGSKAVKVRFRESKLGKVVADLNLYLDSNDTWSVAIVPTANGAALEVADGSCTVPIVAASLGGTGSLPFSNNHYVGDSVGDDSLDRTREGYIEVIEMGPIQSGFSLGGTTLQAAISQIDPGVAANCAAVSAAWQAGVLPGQNSVSANTGRLAGSAHIINLAEGSDISYEPTVLDGWNDGVVPGGGALHTAPGADHPSLDQANPPTSHVFATHIVTEQGDAAAGPVITSQWSNGLDAVSAVLTSFYRSSDYIIDPTLLAGTDWVLTFPTKHLHMAKPDTKPFTNKLLDGKHCEEFEFYLTGAYSTAGWDRRRPFLGTIDLVPIYPHVHLCSQTSVVRFGTSQFSNVLGSTDVVTDMSASADQYAAGWAQMALLDWGTPSQSAAIMTDVSGNVSAPFVGTGWKYAGLPAIGFAAIRYRASDGTALASYGATTSFKNILGIAPH